METIRMFSFFRKKDSGPKVRDVVFATRQAKWTALAELAKQDATTVFVAWFEESRDRLQQYFDSHQVQAGVIHYRELHHVINSLIFIEHYPLAEKEKQLFLSLGKPNIVVYSSLDEAFFQHFGGDKISSLMEKVGMQENEAISHSMITKSIYKAQQKLAEHVITEQSAHSMQEWMQKNVRRL
jgi:hypothetical protein